MILRREMHPSSALRFKRREGQGFILLSKGPDGKEKNVRSMYTTGIIPDMNEYQNEPENMDNIIQGVED